MTTYMLDTNIVSYALRSRPPEVIERLRALEPMQVCISVITLAELRYGADHSGSPERYHSLIDRFIDRIEVRAFDQAAADSYGSVRAELARASSPIGDLDLLIAGHALAADTVLVSNNLREFGRVSGLECESWVDP